VFPPRISKILFVLDKLTDFWSLWCKLEMVHYFVTLPSKKILWDGTFLSISRRGSPYFNWIVSITWLQNFCNSQYIGWGPKHFLETRIFKPIHSLKIFYFRVITDKIPLKIISRNYFWPQWLRNRILDDTTKNVYLRLEVRKQHFKAHI